MTEKCLVCDAEARWIRCTQFAGAHPFCDAHARAEKGFGSNDSYEYWVEAEPADPWDAWKPNKDMI